MRNVNLQTEKISRLQFYNLKDFYNKREKVQFVTLSLVFRAG